MTAIPMATDATQSKEQLMDEMVGFLREMPNGRLEVGVIKKREDGDYHGPVAEVYIEESWLFIVTDTYEGSAMLNVEALPLLQKALSKLAGQAAALRAQATSRGGEK